MATPRLIKVVNGKKGHIKFKLPPKSMEDICNRLGLLYSSGFGSVGQVGGKSSYTFFGSLAKLEKALLRWTMDQLVTRYNFTPIVVPNLLYNHIIENCGFPTKSIRSQVYKIAGRTTNIEPATTPISDLGQNVCIAGTSEFALAAFHIGDTIEIDKLPKKFCAVSRCYRAETSDISRESGIYRVHYFNKVEMVALTEKDRSHDMLDEFLSIQCDLFNELGLHFKVMEMPEDDLGLSASKKYDIEAFMSGRGIYGEISSTSNCTDYQSKRLNIRYSYMETCERTDQLNFKTEFVHTVNGTACASVRMLIALIEQNQTEDGRFLIPEPLQPYMDGMKMIEPNKFIHVSDRNSDLYE